MKLLQPLSIGTRKIGNLVLHAVVSIVLLMLILAAIQFLPLPPTGVHTPRLNLTRRLNKDGMLITYIPSGDFIMGSQGKDAKRFPDEAPEHRVYLDAYWIDKTQVTNAMYALCVKAGACQYSNDDMTNPRFKDPLFANHPVVFIKWKDAAAYCAWQGGRLPSEAEWEKAARGPQGSPYPWGNKHPNPVLLNANNSVGDTTPVGSYPEGQSYYGVLDMGGNVREWVLDWYKDNYFAQSSVKNPPGPTAGDLRVLKGASYQDPYLFSRSANRFGHPPYSAGIERGFRCVVPWLKIPS